MDGKNLRDAVLIVFIILVISIALFIIKPSVDFLIKTYISELAPYTEYVNGAIAAIFVGGGGVLILHIVRKNIDRYFSKKINRSAQNLIELIVSFFMYAVILAIILTSLGINLTGALVGGSVGALIIGIALQGIFSSIFSGFAVTSGGALKPGDVVNMQSWLFSGPITGEVMKISYLFSDIRTQNDNIIKIPNSAFFGNTVFENLGKYDRFSYRLQVSLPSDVSISKIEEKLGPLQDDTRWYFTGSNGSTNTFTVVMTMKNITDINEAIDKINRAFNDAYWKAKTG
ncbi:mechanosensitive ion channel family protein [Thermoplasma sp.]|uniref:mechanosensitive ion channel family protein n=1 Tax=Thermoplasma sp. TaxID=1973142 RepID=UPI00261F569B|nr:mechanosensitive ion channel family protein [Thermoplasma sp.]